MVGIRGGVGWRGGRRGVNFFFFFCETVESLGRDKESRWSWKFDRDKRRGRKSKHTGGLQQTNSPIDKSPDVCSIYSAYEKRHNGGRQSDTKRERKKKLHSSHVWALEGSVCEYEASATGSSPPRQKNQKHTKKIPFSSADGHTSATLARFSMNHICNSPLIAPVCLILNAAHVPLLTALNKWSQTWQCSDTDMT